MPGGDLVCGLRASTGPRRRRWGKIHGRAAPWPRACFLSGRDRRPTSLRSGGQRTSAFSRSLKSGTLSPAVGTLNPKPWRFQSPLATEKPRRKPWLRCFGHMASEMLPPLCKRYLREWSGGRGLFCMWKFTCSGPRRLLNNFDDDIASPAWGLACL
jgi:hypothetical protein